MKLTLIYALLLTHYEADLLNDNLDWDNVINQDFCVHCLYAKEINEVLFINDYTKVDVGAQMRFALDIVSKLGYEIELKRKIVILPNEVDEYCADAVKSYLA